MASNSIVFLDCTLRDGGYYNSWDFSDDLINVYLKAMSAAGVDIVELGLRSLKNEGFKGACAYTTDSFVRRLSIPADIKIGVMVNASELIGPNMFNNLSKLFPESSGISPLKLVRVACHVHEFACSLPASKWLKDRGFLVAYNLMQIADLSQAEVEDLSRIASEWELDALYFADSMGSMEPAQTIEIVNWLRKFWHGPLGIHTHDNLGLALQNTLAAKENGVSWLDATVTGMGRGPGNAKTEHLALELAELTGRACNIVPLMELIRKVFQPMQHKCGWGTNTYYYLAGKYGIHPTYIQEMLSDSRYSEEDILAVINRLRVEGGKKFTRNTLNSARHFYQGEPRGAWSPAQLLKGRPVLLLGTGPGVELHRAALEEFIIKFKPVVLALNTQEQIDPKLIDARIACHPVRLLADCEHHVKLPHPLITPASMLPEEVRHALKDKELHDFGIEVRKDSFAFCDYYGVVPTSLVIAYALAMISSGHAHEIFLAGFDGYEADTLRNQEINKIFKLYFDAPGALPIVSITSTRYDLPVQSVYGLIEV